MDSSCRSAADSAVDDLVLSVKQSLRLKSNSCLSLGQSRVSPYSMNDGSSKFMSSYDDDHHRHDRHYQTDSNNSAASYYNHHHQNHYYQQQQESQQSYSCSSNKYQQRYYGLGMTSGSMDDSSEGEINSNHNQHNNWSFMSGHRHQMKELLRRGSLIREAVKRLQGKDVNPSDNQQRINKSP